MKVIIFSHTCNAKVFSPYLSSKWKRLDLKIPGCRNLTDVISGGGGKLSKLKGSSGLELPNPEGARVLRPGVPIVGGAGSSGDANCGDKLFEDLVASDILFSQGFIMGVTVTG